jgi:hypothetical protein
MVVVEVQVYFLAAASPRSTIIGLVSKYDCKMLCHLRNSNSAFIASSLSEWLHVTESK